MKRTTKIRLGRLDQLASGPPPLNPFTKIRLAGDHTVQSFADACGVSKQALIRLEQGTYNNPLPAVLTYVTDNLDYMYLSVQDDYEAFQWDQRSRYRRLLGDFPVVFPRDIHPLRYLREVQQLNVTELSKALCFPQSTLAHWEKHPRLQQTVPKQLLVILRGIGYSVDELSFLMAAYDAYRKGIINAA